MMRYVPFIIISLILYALFFYHSQQAVLLPSNNLAEEEINPKDKIIPFNLESLEEQQVTAEEQVILEEQQITTSIISDTTQVSENNLRLSTLSEALATNQSIGATNTPATLPISEKNVAENLKEARETKKLTAKEIKPQAPSSESVTLAPTFEMPAAISATPVTIAEPVKTEEKTKAPIVTLPESPDTIEKMVKLPTPESEAHQAALLKGEFYDTTFHLHLSAPVIKNPPTKKIANKKSVVETTQESASTALLTLTQAIPPNQPKISNDKPKRIVKKVIKPIANNSELPEAIVVSGNKPNYPIQAVKQKLQGTVTVKFVVSIEGESQKPKMVASSGYKVLDTTVLDFVKKERFMPSFNGVEKITKEQQFTHKFVAQE